MQRLAELEGIPVSKVVSGIVESFAPTAQQLVEAMQAMANLPETKRAQIAAMVQAVEGDVTAKATDAQAAFTDALKMVGNA